MYLVISCLLLITAGVKCQSYDDIRCKCICPNPAMVLNGTNNSDRKLYLYIANVPPNKCNCDGVIIPSISAQLNGREQEFCPRCDCKYESRNTTVIKVVVTFLVWVIASMIAYMAFVVCLQYLITRRRNVEAYQELNSSENCSLLTTQENDI